MVPLQIAFSGYAIVGLTLLVLAACMAIYLLRIPSKSEATWSLIAFFIMVALSGAATILANAFFRWDRLFMPWQDFWILAGGIAMTHFAYSLPHYEGSREAWAAQGVMAGLALLALIYSFFFDYRFMLHWTPALDINDAYYLLLPAGTLLIVLIFLRRSLYFSARAEPTSGVSSIAQRLIHPQGEDAKALRNLGLALSMAFLPGLQTLFQFPNPYAFVLSNIGSLLAIIAIAIVYFNYASDIDSFMAKLVVITLATMLLIVAVAGAVDVHLAQEDYYAERRRIAASMHSVLVNTGDIAGSPPQAGYVVSWDSSQPAESGGYRQLYPPAAEQNFDLNLLIAENREGILDSRGTPVSGELSEITNDAWRSMWRAWPSPLGHAMEEYYSYIFSADDLAYEIGFSRRAVDNYLSGIVSRWLLLILVAGAVVLIVFPLFLRRTLVQPLENLLYGVRRVNRGDLDTFVPIRFHDEIGSLTDSFNRLTQSLKISQSQQEDFFNRLQASYEELEERVADRTREISAFTDLTMLPGNYEDLSDILQPALNRIMEVGLCQALCVHVLAEDGRFLALVAQRNLPEMVAETLETVPVPASFADRIRQVDDPILTSRQRTNNNLPNKLTISPYENYLGSSLAAGEETHGWLSCYRQAGDEFTMGEIALLVALARQMGVIVENQRLRRRIKEVATYEERQRLARDLHDSVTQLVYSMTLFTRSSQEALEDGDTQRLSANLSYLANTSLQALREMRVLLFELQPPALEAGGLAKALNARFDMVERRVGIQVEADVDESSFDSKRIERELYYVAIEALNNTLKHADAEQVNLIVTQENGSLHLCVADNGCGFDTSQTSAGLGISNMRQRIESLGGDLRIDSVINEGTQVIATIPIM